MTVLRYAIVDVFTDVPLEGNAVAVFIGGSRLDDEAMQRAARELNLSETVFVLPPDEQDPGAGGDARLRIFTPSTELPFAGHPVLGTAFVVGERLAADVVRLQTQSGLIRITLRRERGVIVFGEMDQQVPIAEPFELERELLDALEVERSELPVEAYRNGPRHVYVGLESEEQVAALHPDMRALGLLDGGVGINCFAGAGDRYKTRMFAPALGVPEDPATGSAAGPLAVHLARHGRIAFGQEISIRQGVEIGRPSELHARAEGSAQSVDRVVVGGSALIVARGEYRLA